MSRFFNQSRKTSLSRELKSGDDSVDVKQLLEESRRLEPQPQAVVAVPINSANSIQIKLTLPILTGGNQTAQAAQEAYRTLRTRLLRLQVTRKMRSVAITSAAQGDGKTLTSLNLALCCARLFTKVLLVDGDLRTGSLSALMSNAHSPGLAELLEGQAPFESAIVSTNMDNLFVVAAGQSALAASELYAKPRWQDFIEWCSERFELVLVDSPPILGLADFELIASRCDGVLAVVRARITGRDAFEEATQQIDKKKFLGIVLNAYESPLRHRHQYYRYYAGSGGRK